MSNPPAKSSLDAPWYTPPHLMQLAGGEFMLKTGKPIQRATGPQVARMTGVSLKTLRHLADSGFIRCAKVTRSKHFYYPGEVEAFIARTEADPNFWDDVKHKAYLTGMAMRDKPRKEKAENLKS